MKKHTVLALVGTLALLANLLVPGLAFGATGAQSGTANLTCNSTIPTFTIDPEASFDFQIDGNTVADIAAQIASRDVFNNPAGALNTGAGADYIEVEDIRDPSQAGCNNGLTVVLNAVDPDADGYFFDGGPAGSGLYVPLNTTYVITSANTCPAGSTVRGTGVCISNTALCGVGDGTPAIACTDEGIAALNAVGTAFATIGTFTGVTNSTIGTDINTNAGRTILSFTNNNELYGRAGTGVAFAATLRPGQPIGNYTLNMEYVLTGL